MEAKVPDLKIPESIFIGNKIFKHLQTRSLGGTVLVSEDKKFYARIGNREQITKEVDLAYELYKRGFPTPQPIEQGELPNGKFFYIEASVGGKIFEDVFEEETKGNGRVGEESFDVFTSTVEKYARAQFDKRNVINTPRSLEKIIHIDNILRNNPPTDREAFDRAFEKVSARMKELPWSYMHNDLTAFNILEGGVIDFEFSGYGPVGYDIIANLYFVNLWPRKNIAYVLTDEQVTDYLRRIDRIALNNGLPAMSEYKDDFLMLLLYWSTMKGKESEDAGTYLDFWKWRSNVRDWAISEYLSGRPIDYRSFEAVGNAVQE